MFIKLTAKTAPVFINTDHIASIDVANKQCEAIKDYNSVITLINKEEIWINETIEQIFVILDVNELMMY